MQSSTNNRSKDFSNRAVTVNQAVRVLKRNGIEADETQAGIILDFLYLLAKRFRRLEDPEIVKDLKGKSNT